MDASELDRRSVGGNGNPEIAEWIEGDRCPNVFRRRRVKDRVGLVQDPVKPRDRDLGSSRSVLDFAIAKSAVITPGSVK